MASQVLRDVVVRAGERASSGSCRRSALSSTLAIAGLTRRAARRRHVGEPLGAARRRRRRRRLRVLGHAAGRAHGAQACSRRRRRRAASARPSRQSDHARRLTMCGRYELHSHPAAIALAFGLAQPPGRARALQHRADDRGADRARQRRGPARARAHALGPRSALGEGPVDRRADDQRPRRDDRRQAVVPDAVSPASLPAAGRRLLRMARRAGSSRRGEAARKQPLHIGMADGSLFGLAGLYERWRSEDGERARHLHDRDDGGQRAARADPRPDAVDRRAASTTRAGSIRPMPTSPTSSCPIRRRRWRTTRCRTRVNSVRHDDASVLERVEPAAGEAAPSTSRRRTRRSRNRCSDRAGPAPARASRGPPRQLPR